jgi:hypothetical protein
MSKSVWGQLLVGAVVGAAAFSAGCHNRPQLPGGDDDRPPIVVSSGSVHLQIVAKNRGTGTNESRGQWTLDSHSNPSTWFHDHGGPPANHLVVTVIHGSGNSGTGCDDSSHNFIVRELSIAYGPQPTNTSSFRLFIDAQTATAPGNVKTDLTGSQASTDPAVPFWLNVGLSGDRLQSVTFQTSPSAIKCTVDPTLGQVQIYQSTSQ